MDEELIEFVRCHEELYNFADKRYSDNSHKQKLWRELATQLQKSPEYCKKRWESIRAQFRKVYRFRKTKTGQAADNEKKWKYEAELSFLLPYMKDKGRLTSLDNVDDLMSNHSDDLVEDEALIEEDTQMSNNVSQTATPALSQISNSPAVSHVGSIGVTSQPDRKRARTAGKKNSAYHETASSTLMKYIIEEKKNAQQPHEKDVLDHFFDGIKETIKTFTPGDKLLAKKKIFNIVSEIEEKYINIESNQCQTTTPTQLQTIVPDNRYPYCNQHVNVPILSPTYTTLSNTSHSSTPSCSSYYEAFSPPTD